MNNNHPDAAQFMSAYKSAVINQIMIPGKVGNVEADLSKFIVNDNEIKNIGFVNGQYKRSSDSEECNGVEVEQVDDLNELSSIYWTTGWACSTINHKDCLDRLRKLEEKVTEDVTFLAESKKYTPTSKIVTPGNTIFQYFKEVCHIFGEKFDMLLKQSPIGVKAELKKLIEEKFHISKDADNADSAEAENDDSLLFSALCPKCAAKITDRYLNMLMGCRLTEMNSTFKSMNDQKKASKKTAKAKKLNINRPSCIA